MRLLLYFSFEMIAGCIRRRVCASFAAHSIMMDYLLGYQAKLQDIKHLKSNVEVSMHMCEHKWATRCLYVVFTATATKYFICRSFSVLFSLVLCAPPYIVFHCRFVLASNLCVYERARARLCVCRQTICCRRTVARLPQLMARERRKAR